MSKLPTETDPRFPTGKWVGFFLDKRLPGRHQMEVVLTFASGRMSGEGRDRVGKFTFEGNYSVADGRCDWVKRYVGKHAVHYNGFNEGKGIWGTWELRDSALTFTGGFHIWPEGMADPTQPRLVEEADVPVEDVAPPVREPELVPSGDRTAIAKASVEAEARRVLRVAERSCPGRRHVGLTPRRSPLPAG